ncbi:MAG: hypothetical protein QGH33_10715, partial [Pirellulaceae bacterium]|nr:hypothetical protein [Pirellulaceae bacterium]
CLPTSSTSRFKRPIAVAHKRVRHQRQLAPVLHTPFHDDQGPVVMILPFLQLKIRVIYRFGRQDKCTRDGSGVPLTANQGGGTGDQHGAGELAGLP